ncbi:hypothetical protein [Stenotrophomonas maltophilia]|uniref:Uncharacterized protein n=1 Tax=Stenotrophomonas maltophilia TaxID=40324 RepID=A0A2W6HYL4_STEMA|nr:hypothetical protein [Stenotrophomonas maltophilia]PZS88183.1 hypothetical protein A7X83_15815 [Stenotrophomonas maltophilia]
MTTDNKTLAEVQPGGRVRLGDQAERARFEAWNRENWPNLDLSRGPLGDYMQARVRSDWQLWQAALSAQPHQPSSFNLEAMLAACVPGGDIADPQVIADNIRHWFAAQPSPGGQDADLAPRIRGIAGLVEVARPHEAMKLRDIADDLAARQPVGQSMWVEIRREGDRTFPRVMKRDQAEAFLRTCNVGPLPTIHALYAAPTAQAVDLGLQLDRYDAGLLGNGGGGDVSWWQDYIRAELDRAHEFYQDQTDAHG